MELERPNEGAVASVSQRGDDQAGGIRHGVVFKTNILCLEELCTYHFVTISLTCTLQVNVCYSIKPILMIKHYLIIFIDKYIS